MRHGFDDMPSYGNGTSYLKSTIGPLGGLPMHTLISVMGFAAGNYGNSYGQLCSTKQEREAKRVKRKARKKAQQRNR